MKKRLAALAINPMTYVLGFASSGAASVVAGVGIIAGAGSAFIVGGVFLLAAAAYLTRGMTPNG